MANTTDKNSVVTYLLFGQDWQGRPCLVGNLRSLIRDDNGKPVSNGGIPSLLGENFKPGEDLATAFVRGCYEEWTTPELLDVVAIGFEEIGEIETGKSYNFLVAPNILRPLRPNDVQIKEGYGAMFFPISHLGAAKEYDFLTEASFGVLTIISEDTDELIAKLLDMYYAIGD